MGWWHAWRERVLVRLRPSLRERDLQQELQHHLDVESARLRERGLSPDDARERALARLGDPVVIAGHARDARGPGLFEGVIQDVRVACRSLGHHRAFSTTGAATLALGIGAATATFAIFDAVLLQPLPYAGADRLVYLQEVTERRTIHPPSHPNVVDWRARAQSFEGVASAMFPSPAAVKASPTADPVRVTTMGLSRAFLKVLGVAPLHGREFSGDENVPGGPAVAMVAHEFWQSQMNGRLPLGDILVGGQRRTVVGVLPPDFTFVTPASVYLPHEQAPGTCRTCRNYMVVGRMREHVGLDRARGEMTALTSAMRREYGDDILAVDVDVQPLQEYLVGSHRTMLTLVLVASGLVLLIAGMNLLGAQLARGWHRERELLVRSALGASRLRLVRQLLIESTVLVSAGAAAGVVLASGIVRFVAAAGADQVPRLGAATIDPRVLAASVGASVLIVVMAGVYPALRFSRAGGGGLRTTRGTGTVVRASAWRLLLGAEIAMAVALTIGASLLIRTLDNIMEADTGFEINGLLTAAMTPRDHEVSRLEETRGRLSALPGVLGTAYTTRLPLSWGSSSGPVRRPSDPPGPAWPAFAGFRMVSPGYFDVLRQPILQGRAFTTADHEKGEPVAIITPGIARALWPGEDPIGRTISTNYLWDEWLTVVGVAGEASIWSQAKGAQNEIYVPMDQHRHALAGQSQVVAMIRTAGDPAALTEPVRRAVLESFPDSPPQVRPMLARLEQSAASRRFVMVTLTSFAVVALLLAAIGIYGVVGYMVTTQSRETGIRLALGETPDRVRRRVLAGAVFTAAPGCLIGILSAGGATRWLEALLYGVSRTEASAYVASTALIMLAVLAGAWVPAWRASRIDPLTSMRTDG